ncbi:MAG: OmpA family protein [Gemmatimonadales bacterium]|nr:MAG: OmpA family protein [Gemmatimonadales bacterium]
MRRPLTGLTALALAASLVSVNACSTNTGRGAIIGAAAGAAVGAAVGSTGGSTTKGAIMGAVLGGAAGALIGRRMDQKAEELARRLPNASIERVGEGILITFDSGILFGFDSSDLTAEARSNLAALANSLNDLEDDAILMVAGHTDATGSDAYNQALSERRAAAAATYLTQAGMDPAQLQTLGLGETEPIADNSSEAGQSQNRRVEVAIYASEEYRQRVQSRVGQ